MPSSPAALAPALFLLLMAFAPSADAQGPPGPMPRYQSPEVHPDGRVTVRLLAPSAGRVLLTGEILDGRQPLAMIPDSTGIWSLTVGPLQPDIYTYAFTVDGVNTPDPLNPYVKPVAQSGLATQVEVPGQEPRYYDMVDVPHGVVSILPYESRALGVARTAWVYTPPGYSGASAERYPVLYLLHGVGDTESGWVLTGRANLILDNLIAAGRARPMVVVMPLGHATQSLGVGPLPAGGVADPMGGLGADMGAGAIQRDLLGDLIPLVERTFRVSTSADDRAIMGLSMGGAQALHIGLGNLDRFHSVVALSSALVGADPVAPFAPLLADPQKVNQALKLFHLSIGDTDFLLEGNRKFDAALTAAGIRHDFKVTSGGHWWRVWRRDLYELAPLLFR